MSAVADKLREARAYVDYGWTQDAWARDASGMEHMESEPGVVCWCASGAMFLVGDKHTKGIELIDFFAEANGLKDIGVANWNDTPGRTQAEVLAAFDKAISLAEQEAA